MTRGVAGSSDPTISGAYCIRNIITGELYIGSSYDLKKRTLDNFAALRRGQHHSKKLQSSFNEHAREAFAVEYLEVVGTRFDHLRFQERTDNVVSFILDREAFYIDFHSPTFNTNAGETRPVARKPAKKGSKHAH